MAIPSLERNSPENPQTPKCKGSEGIPGDGSFCSLWIPGFAELANPLHEATNEQPGFTWTDSHRRPWMDALKQAQLSGARCN